MPDIAPVPEWPKRTQQLHSELEASYQPPAQQQYQQQQPAQAQAQHLQPSAWDAFETWSTGWSPYLDVNSLQYPEQQPPIFPTRSFRAKASLRSSTPDSDGHDSPPLFSPTSPAEVKLEHDTLWPAFAPHHSYGQPVRDVPSSVVPGQIHDVPSFGPVELDGSSEETERSPRSYCRYSPPPVLTELASCDQQPMNSVTQFQDTFDGSLCQDPRDWLTLPFPEFQGYDEPSTGLLGATLQSGPSKLNGVQGFPTQPNDLQWSNEFGDIPSNMQDFGSATTGPTAGWPTSGQTSSFENVDEYEPERKVLDSRLTSRETSVSSGDTANETGRCSRICSSRTTPFSPSPTSSNVLDNSPKPISLKYNSEWSTPNAERKRKEKGSVTKVEKAGKPLYSLQIVQEDGLGGSVSHSARLPAPARARRNGPLSVDGRRNAAIRRKDRSVCVWCRLAKKKCSGESPCTTCLEQAKTLNFEQPCVKADFFQIVESGTCNYISQRAVNHMTLDGSTRVRMELPSSFEMKQLLALLDERRSRFNIRARQSWGSLYVLDLDETYRFLEELRGGSGKNNSHYDLGDFIDNRILKSNNWVKCVKDVNPTEDIFALLSQWNNMPSRASYYFTPTTDNDNDQTTSEQPMDVENPEHQREILLAAQISRIICRKLEVDGYRALQNVLNKNKWDEVPCEPFAKFVSELGQILLTLRWRVSWWELLGDGGSKPDAAKERYEERVRSLSKILYFYYMSVKLKLPAWSNPNHLDGVWSTYADASAVWDDFPRVSTIEGFEAWMDRGKQLIQEAGVKSRISKF